MRRQHAGGGESAVCVCGAAGAIPQRMCGHERRRTVRPPPNRQYFKDGSLQALFLWNEVNQGKLVMYVAKLASENTLHGGARFTAGNLGCFTVSSSANHVTGASPDTIVVSKPLEFARANDMRYDS